MFGHTRVQERVSARPAVSCAFRRTFSTVFGQQDISVHGISILPFHACVHSRRSSRIPYGNTGIVMEHSIDSRLSASTYDRGGMAASHSMGSVAGAYEYDSNITSMAYCPLDAYATDAYEKDQAFSAIATQRFTTPLRPTISPTLMDVTHTSPDGRARLRQAQPPLGCIRFLLLHTGPKTCIPAAPQTPKEALRSGG